jgi:hypothetical protein
MCTLISLVQRQVYTVFCAIIALDLRRRTSYVDSKHINSQLLLVNNLILRYAISSVFLPHGLCLFLIIL